MELRGKNVVITGGSQGIGECLADSFGAAGAKVLVIARSQAKLETVAARVGGDHIVADLTDADTVDGIVDACIDKMGRIDVWINNAGVETHEALVNVDPAALRTLSRLNFEAPLIITRDISRHMMVNGGGRVVQVASVAGAVPFPGLSAYCGSKAGLTAFTESLRIEMADTGVEYTVVSPGPIATEMWDRLDTGHGYAAPALRRFAQMLFLPKLAPTKVATTTLEAVRKDKRFARMPARFNGYHFLNNAPRRLVEASLVGVDLKPELD